MTALDFVRPLQLGGEPPCPEAITWLEQHPEQTLAEAWARCPRGDWMLWLLHAAGWSDQYSWELRVFAVEERERRVRRTMTRGVEIDPRSWRAIAVAWRYLRGQASEEELAAARADAWDAAWDAARADAWDAAWDAARADARADVLQRQADRLREIIEPDAPA